MLLAFLGKDRIFISMVCLYHTLKSNMLATRVLKGLKCYGKDAFESLFGCVGDYSAFSHVLIHTVTITHCVVSKYDLQIILVMFLRNRIL